MPRTSLLGTIEIASSLIGKVKIGNYNYSKDQLNNKAEIFLEKPDGKNDQEVPADYDKTDINSQWNGVAEFFLEKPEGRNDQEVSAEYKKSKVNSQWNGVAEVIFEKPEGKNNQEVSADDYLQRNGVAEFLFTEPVRSQKTEHEKVITDDEVRKDDLRKEVDSFEFPGVDPKFRKPLADLIFEYILIFASSSSELGSTDLIKHTIDTQGRGPIRLRPYRIHVKYRDIVIKLLAELKAAGIIEESISAWAAPVVIVIKKNGEIRVCVDYRKLNSITKKILFRCLVLTIHWINCMERNFSQHWIWHPVIIKLNWKNQPKKKQHL